MKKNPGKIGKYTGILKTTGALIKLIFLQIRVSILQIDEKIGEFSLMLKIIFVYCREMILVIN